MDKYSYMLLRFVLHHPSVKFNSNIIILKLYTQLRREFSTSVLSFVHCSCSGNHYSWLHAAKGCCSTWWTTVVVNKELTSFLRSSDDAWKHIAERYGHEGDNHFSGRWDTNFAKCCAQKGSSEVDGWLSSVVCWPTLPARGQVSHYFTCGDCSTSSENHTL